MALENKLGIADSAELARVEKKMSKKKVLELSVKDVEIKFLLQNAPTNKINDYEVYMKDIDASYHYEGYHVCKTEELK